MSNEFTHRVDAHGILRQIVSPAALLDSLDESGDDYTRPESFNPEDEWDTGEPLHSEEWHAGYSYGERF